MPLRRTSRQTNQEQPHSHSAPTSATRAQSPNLSAEQNNVLSLQRTIGNQAVQRVIQRKEPAPVSTTSRPVIQRAGLHDPDWEQVAETKYISSTNGGVVIFTFESGEKLVLKSSPYAQKEIFANRLAREARLSAPDIRLIPNEELKRIGPHLKVAMSEGFMPAGGFTLMEFVKGFTLGSDKKNKVNKSITKSLSTSLGQWLAFDLTVGEGDRFRGLKKQDQEVNINDGNLMFENKNPSFSGVDQSSMMLGPQPVDEGLLGQIKGGDQELGMRMITPMLRMLGMKSKKPGKYSNLLLGGAQDMFARMSQLDPDRVMALAEGLELGDGDAEQVVQNILQLRETL